MPKLYQAPFYTVEELERLEEQEIHFPYSDRYMKYDSLKRQYIPTETLLLKHGLDITEILSVIGDTSQRKIEEELEYISDQIYSYIYKNSGSSNEVLKWIIAKGVRRGMHPYRFRQLFQEILCKQARYYINNDDLTKSTGIDIVGKQWINKGVLINEDRQIDPKVKLLLQDLGLSYVGSYDRQFLAATQREDW